MPNIEKNITDLDNGPTDQPSIFTSQPELTITQQFQLLLADQQYRSQRGMPFDSHEYIRQFEWLAADPQLQLKLIGAEFSLSLGSKPAKDLVHQFKSRYSAFGDAVKEELATRLKFWNQQAIDPVRVARVSSQFENSLQSGTTPILEEWLERFPEAWQGEILRNLIRLEVRAAVQRGLKVNWEEYQQRFPSFRSLLSELPRQLEGDTGAYEHGRSTSLSDSTPQRSTSTDLSGSFISHQMIGDLRNGRYRLDRKLGEGAYGIVYLAYDLDLKRPVAVKVPRPDAMAKLASLDTYVVEAQHVASLDHPGIVTLYDIGRTLDGSVYIVSRYIQGNSLGEWVKQHQLDIVSIVGIIIKVAESLQHAHSQRLIHRDIKPANILIESATGLPFITDFGLAIREEDYLPLARKAGTPTFMSPEQVRGEGHRLDGRSDLFSLGVVMYLMLTGRLPFSGRTRQEVAFEITSVEPIAPRSVRSDIPEELERICLRLLRKRVSERYRSGKELAEELSDWLTSRRGKGNSSQTMPIVPRGLRSFSSNDATFFLDLLPGPRNRDGLPESIAFWKERIEQRESDLTFAVGLLFGPSGCGKTSLIKAGVIPHLSNEIVPIYIEATPTETELRLVHALEKRFPNTIDVGTLAAQLAHLRGTTDRKIVLFIDQFEQWLYSHNPEGHSDFIDAMRQCDGKNLQAIIMVRDDFAMAVSRFMQALEIRIIEGDNFATVDLFDIDHAQKVLTKFGQAYGRLPMDKTSIGREEQHFIREVCQGLATDGKVISVRLSLFADMVRKKTWVHQTLIAVGGTEGVGVNFLEETFFGHDANPEHRRMSDAARKVLQMLLPEVGRDIKGSMKSEDELQIAADYENRDDDFENLMRVLDGELRLITPTDPEGDDSFHSSDNQPRRFYQLTHDFLIPSLREWLFRNQQKTWSGRAELRLAERASAWTLLKENKQLPTFGEWFCINTLTSHQAWTTNQRAMVQKANWYHLLRTSTALFLVALAIALGLATISAQKERIESQRVEGIVASLSRVDPSQLPMLAADLQTNWTKAEEFLRPLVNAPGSSKEERRLRLHAQMMSVKQNRKHIEPLLDELVNGRANYILPIIELLRPYSAECTHTLTRTLRDSSAKASQRFRAAIALAEFIPEVESEFWNEEDLTLISRQLVAYNPDFQPTLRDGLRPIAKKLISHLERIFDDSNEKDRLRVSAANALADFAADDINLLTRLLTKANPEQFSILYPLVSTASTESAQNVLQGTVNKLLPDDASVEDKEWLGKRRANAAVALLKMGQFENIQPVFQWSSDPEALIQFIVSNKPREIPVETLIDALNKVAAAPRNQYPTDTKYGLLLAIGEYVSDEIPSVRREELITKLVDWYANDPNSAVHGAAGWLLRHLGEDAAANKIDHTVVPYEPGRQWYTVKVDVVPTIAKLSENFEETSKGGEPALKESASIEDESKESVDAEKQKSDVEDAEVVSTKSFYFTFIVFPAGEYSIGSREYQPNRQLDETRHSVVITYPFAILDRELTFAEIIACSPKYKEFMQQFELKEIDAGFGSSWYDAVDFCRWLGEQSGLPESEQPYALPSSFVEDRYPRETDPEAKDYPRDWPVVLNRRGFRLPTETEWEIAAGAGTETAFGFGNETSLLERFGWFDKNSGGKARATRMLRPNLRGLFDLHGNLAEWTHDWYDVFTAKKLTDPTGPEKGTDRVQRGGSWGIAPSFCRTSLRYSGAPTFRSDFLGFRPAVTIIK